MTNGDSQPSTSRRPSDIAIEMGDTNNDAGESNVVKPQTSRKKQIKDNQRELAKIGSDGLSGFERFCLTPDSAAEIKICMSLKLLKATTRNENQQIYPITLAIRSGDPKNVAAILRHQDINFPYDSKTVLHLLFLEMSDENFTQLFACFKSIFQLQAKGIADPNIQDDKERSPIEILLRSEILSPENKKEVLEMMIKKTLTIEYTAKTGRNPDETINDLIKKLNTELSNKNIQNLPSDLEISCLTGDSAKLKTLLRIYREDLQITLMPLFAIVVRELCKTKDKQKSYESCLKVLIQTKYVHHLVDVPDERRYSAIHYAASTNNKDVVLKLLNISIYLGLTASTRYSLKEVEASILKEHFDNCISKNNMHSCHTDFRLRFNYQSFNPMRNSEISFFRYISDNKDLRHLILHPAVSLFLYFKWLKIKNRFMGTLLISILYFIYSMWYFGFCAGDANVLCSHPIFWLLAFIFYIIMLVNSFLYFPNINLLLRLLLYPRKNCYADEPIFYTFLLFLSAIELLNCIKGTKILGLSKLFFLFKSIMRNFLKVFPLYIICVVTFSIAFLKYFKEQNQMSKLSGNETEYETFGSPSIAILRSVVMSMGELDASSFDIGISDSFYWLLILFIFSISIVLSNLLIALAVTDTQETLAEGILNDIKFRVQIMYYNEKLPKSYHQFKLIIRKLLPMRWLNQFFEGSSKQSGRTWEILLYPNRRFSYESETNAFKIFLRRIKTIIPIKIDLINNTLGCIIRFVFGSNITIQENLYTDPIYFWMPRNSSPSRSSPAVNGTNDKKAPENAFDKPSVNNNFFGPFYENNEGTGNNNPFNINGVRNKRLSEPLTPINTKYDEEIANVPIKATANNNPSNMNGVRRVGLSEPLLPINTEDNEAPANTLNEANTSNPCNQNTPTANSDIKKKNSLQKGRSKQLKATIEIRKIVTNSLTVLQGTKRKNICFCGQTSKHLII